MKNKKTVFATILTLVLALSLATVSASAVTINEMKADSSAANRCAAVTDASDDCAGHPLEGFIKELSFLTEQEKQALLADLSEADILEKQINEIYARMTDENSGQLYEEIDVIEGKLTATLERNAELWERVNDEYDEKIAANDPDMTMELNEADFDDTCPAEEAYEEFVKK